MNEQNVRISNRNENRNVRSWLTQYFRNSLYLLKILTEVTQSMFYEATNSPFKTSYLFSLERKEKFIRKKYIIILVMRT